MSKVEKTVEGSIRMTCLSLRSKEENSIGIFSEIAVEQQLCQMRAFNLSLPLIPEGAVVFHRIICLVGLNH